MCICVLSWLAGSHFFSLVSARKGEGSDKQKALHNSSAREEGPIERTKPPCRRRGVTRPIFSDHPVIVEDLMQAGPA